MMMMMMMMSQCYVDVASVIGEACIYHKWNRAYPVGDFEGQPGGFSRLSTLLR